MAGNNFFDDDLNEITSEADDLVSCMTATDQEDWDAQYRATLKNESNRGKRTGGSRLVESSAPKKKSGGKGGLIALLIILLILIAALAAAFLKMNSSGGDLTSLMFWKQEQQQEETLPPSTESQIPETESAEESVQPSEEPEAGDEAEVPQVSSPGTTVDTSDVPLMQVIPTGFSMGLTTVNYDGLEQADAPVSLDKSILDSVQELLDAASQAAEDGGYSDTETLRLHAFKVATGDPDEEIAEHETGLAVDFETYQNQHVWEFASAAPNTSAWLQEHAHEYGFIQRFPADKESVTGVSGQPWHYSYVGVTVATEMYENDWCLEEYLAR